MYETSSTAVDLKERFERHGQYTPDNERHWLLVRFLRPLQHGGVHTRSLAAVV